MPTPNLPLPPTVQHSLDALAWRIRLGRVLQGLGILLGVSALILALGFGLDQTLGLETPHLRVTLVVLSIAASVIALRWLVLPLVWSPSTDRLAAILESRHPYLAERFTSLIHLGRLSEEGHGSPAFKQALANQAEEVGARVDVADAFPLKRPARVSLAGGFAFALALLISSSSSPSYVQRLLTSFSAPWHGYTLHISPGDHAFIAGQRVQISVEVTPLQPTARLPQESWLVLRDAAGKEKRISMLLREGEKEPDEDGLRSRRFTHELSQVVEPITYSIEAGGLTGDEHRLIPVAALHLAEGSFRAILSPPPYVRSDPVSLTLDKTIQAKQYGTLELTFAVNRAPVGGKIIWKDAKGAALELPTLHPLFWNGPQGRGVWLLPEATTLFGTCILEAEHGITFQQALPPIEVMADEAPRISLTLAKPGTGVSGPIIVPPGDTLLFKLKALDEEGLGQMSWEYRANEGEVRLFALRDGQEKKSIDEDVLFPLPSDAKVGDRLRLRLCVQDNRRLKRGSVWANGGVTFPPKDLEPNTTYHVLDLLVQDVDPLRKREVLARRDEIDAVLKELVKKVDSLRTDVGALRASSHQQPTLRPDQQKRLEKLVEKNREVRLETLILAEKLSEEGGLDPLALKLEALVQKELAESEAALEGLPKNEPGMRDRGFHHSEDRLLQSVRKLQDMFKLNEVLAQDRLDRFKLGVLAEEEARLAQKLEKEGLKGIEEDQDRIRKGLEALVESSPLLGGMLKDMEKQRAEEAVKRLEELAREARDPEPLLARMSKEELDAFAQLAKEQAELAGRVDAWQAGADKEDRVEHSRRASEAMDRSKWVEALGQQKHAEEGLRLRADLLETGGKTGLRHRVQHLAKTQASIYRDLFQLGEELPRLKQEEQMERLGKIHKAQEELGRNLAALKVPDKFGTSHAQAKGIVEEILVLQGRKDYLGAFLKMEEAPRLLEGLASQIPEGLKDPSVPKGSSDIQERAKSGRGLGRNQTALRERLEKLLAQASQRTEKERAENSKMVREKADEVAADLLKLSQKMEPSPGKGKMEGAAKLAKEAGKGMAAVEKSPAKTGPEMEKESALKLEMAGKMAREAMEGMKKGPAKDDVAMRSPDGAKNVEESKRDLDRASMDLKKGDASGAAKSMARAAQAMKRAAADPKSGKRSFASGKTLGKTPASGGTGPAVSGKIPEKALEKFAGKAWGELPGEAKAQLILDLQQRFGEEYQPLIQRYFENLSREEERKR